MNKESFLKIMIILGSAYNKQFDEQEVNIYYDFLKDYDENILKKAIKRIIETNSYIPKISEIKEMCNCIEREYDMQTIERMKQDGYFKSANELDKILMWMNEGIIPECLRKDMGKYNNDLIENKGRLMING